MSFLHVLGDIGRVALKIVPFLPIPGPVGVLATGVSAVLDQEVKGGSGEAKLSGATATTTVGLTSAGIPVEGKLTEIIALLNGIVAVLNALARLVGPTAQPTLTIEPKA